MGPTSITELVAQGAPGAPAIAAPGRSALVRGALAAQMSATVSYLNQCGIGRGERVAIVLPNGPEMATAFLSVAAGMTAAPLNPAYRREEFEFYLGDLGAKALILAKGDESPARAVADEQGIPVFELEVADGATAGSFSLARVSGPEARPTANGGPAAGDETALVLHTSGTTARPKIVPLSQANLCASAGHIAATLALTPDDLCLNVMPLFHIHGLVGAVLSSLRVGAAVCCTSGFNALRFFTWLTEVRPTWYTAVPTMHQAILARAKRNPDAVADNRLRLIRSSSSSLPPQVMAELEATFDAPVIESYGMTEAAHQMTSSPLPPAARKPGSVGLAAGPDVAILGPGGVLLPAGQEGEIVIRGPNVTAGYENNPAANADAFTDGWFRTGDQGVMDREGYLTITGRIKEMINRGGEKISPREIDEVLMDHPAVAQAVAFALPHPMLGEEVAAAVVPAEGATPDERELRAFVATRLADFKVPKTIVILDEIPKGATGKLQRIGLADKLGLVAASDKGR